MINRWLLVCVLILIWTSVGSAAMYVDLGYSGGSSHSGPAVILQPHWGLAMPITPNGLLVTGYLGQVIVTGPGPSSASGAHGGYVTATQTDGSSSQSSTVAGFQIGSVSGPGIGSVQSHATVVTWQYQQ